MNPTAAELAAERAEYKRLVEEGAWFVFGSNEAGHHGGGAARDAYDYFGAEWGVGWGFTGWCFAFPTKDENIQTLPMSRIADYVAAFLEIAASYPSETFAVTRLGCGLAGLQDEDMAPLFRNAPQNCLLPSRWVAILEMEASNVA